MVDTHESIRDHRKRWHEGLRFFIGIEILMKSCQKTWNEHQNYNLLAQNPWSSLLLIKLQTKLSQNIKNTTKINPTKTHRTWRQYDSQRKGTDKLKLLNDSISCTCNPRPQISTLLSNWTGNCWTWKKQQSEMWTKEKQCKQNCTSQSPGRMVAVMSTDVK